MCWSPTFDSYVHKEVSLKGVRGNKRVCSLWRTWMASSMLVDQMKSLASHVLRHYWNLSYISLCTLNNWKLFNSLVPVYWGLYGYPEQRGMDGTPRSPVQRLAEAKEKVRYVWPVYFFPSNIQRLFRNLEQTPWMQLPICHGWFCWQKGHSLHQKSILH